MNPYLAAALAEEAEKRDTKTSASKKPAKKAAESAASTNPADKES